MDERLKVAFYSAAMTKPRPATLDAPWVAGLIRVFSKANVWIYRKTGGRIGNRWRLGSAFWKPAPVCLLTTTGRKSGQPRVAPLLYGRDGDRVIVIGSQGGLPRHPQWYLNLEADPNVSVQIDRQAMDMRARVAEGEERERLWKSMVSLYADFETYQSWTDRTIPVVVLEPRTR